MSIFLKNLEYIGLDKEIYLEAVKVLATKKGYDPNNIFFSIDKKDKKLYYLYNNKKIYFGASNYNDFIIYSFKEYRGDDINALEKKHNYHQRAKETARKTKNKYSPANLSLNLLW